MSSDTHYSVLLEESVNALVWQSEGIYLDGTFGRGGHSRAILQRLDESGLLVAFDKDPQAIAYAEANMPSVGFEIVHDSFASMHKVVSEKGLQGKVAGILLDLGVSSPQLDEAHRGFSFIKDGPLDMRMNSSAGISAAEWVNETAEQTMVTVFKEYGEERFAKRIARAICERRVNKPFERTLDLAEVVAAANPKWERDKHPATRCFQAIRIEINQELSDLETVLDQSVELLKQGGRIVVISFHSLEDRIVKRFFKRQTEGKVFPRDVPVTEDMLDRKLKLVGKAQKASANELAENIRSRSAVMRVAEKL